MNLNDFRQKYPQYEKVPDDQLADGLYKKFYSSMPREAFNQKLGITPSPASGAPASQLPPVMQQAMAANPNVPPSLPRQQPTAAPQAPMRPPVQQPQQAAPQQEASLVDRIAQDVGKRFDTGVNIMKTPGQNPASVGLQMAGKVVAGTAGDIAGEVLKSAGETVWGMLPDSIKTKIQDEPLVKGAVKAAQSVGEVYSAISNSDYMKKHPEALANMESLKDIATAVPMGKAAGLGGKAVGEATGLSGIARGIAAPSEAKQDLILGAMHKKATDTIENLKNSNVRFKQNMLTPLKDELNKHPDLQTAGEAGARPQTNQIVKSLVDSVDKGDTSINNLIGFRDQLTKVAGMGGQDGTAAIKAQKSLDKALDNIPEFKKFQKQWGQYKLGQDVSSAMQLADVSPAKSRSAFRKIADSDYFNSFDPKVQALIKTASKGKMSGKLMETIGILKKFNGGQKLGKLGSVVPGAEIAGAAALGHPGLAAGIAGSMVAGKGGELVQRGLGADVLKYLQDSQ